MDAREIRTNFEKLAAEVRAADGYLSVRMGTLRDRVGARRLDGGPVQQIKYNLDEVGLRATNLTTAQEDWALVYDTTSPMGRVIASARGDTPQADEHLREAIRELARSDVELRTQERDELEQLRATVEQIRALISTSD